VNYPIGKMIEVLDSQREEVADAETDTSAIAEALVYVGDCIRATADIISNLSYGIRYGRATNNEEEA